MKKVFVLFFLLLSACSGTAWKVPDDFVYVPIKSGEYEIATWQKINKPENDKIHIYIEGDGYAFDAYGQPTSDPTPHGTFVRDLATRDNFDNVVYVARPCQFIMTDSCKETDWTSGRFSQKVIAAEGGVINKISGNKKITLIGYSGGAMVSGLVIEQNPNLKVNKWITVAGVLNHKKWTDFFGDEELKESLNLENLPNVPQKHFVGGHDETVQPELAKQWANESDIEIIPSATHDDFGNLKIFD